MKLINTKKKNKWKNKRNKEKINKQQHKILKKERKKCTEVYKNNRNSQFCRCFKICWKEIMKIENIIDTVEVEESNEKIIQSITKNRNCNWIKYTE